MNYVDSAEGSPDGAALELRDVTSGYGGVVVLRNVSLEVAPGSVVALLGPNGAGKTTLLRTAAGLNQPSAGSVYLNGRDVTSRPPHTRTKAGLCLIPEGRAIFRSLSVDENLRLQRRTRGGQDTIDAALEAFPVLRDRRRQLAGSLSGGEQQMLALARAYCQNPRPRIVLVDEASLGLAPIVVDLVFEFLAGLARQGAALLIVDQFVKLALELASRTYMLVNGQIKYAGASPDLLATDVFAQYLGR